MNDKHVRWMVTRDFAAVMAIEQICFEFPWSEEEFINCLKRRNVIGMVVEAEENVVGYMVYELFKDKLQLLNIAIDPNKYKSGYGRAMVQKLIGKLTPIRRTNIEVMIRAKNLGAQLFFKNMGFFATKVLEDYYDNGEEAYLLLYNIKKQFSWENRISKFIEVEND